MGIVVKQTIKGTIWSYLGVAIGFVTTSYLYPKYLTPEVVGLFGLLISYSVILSNFSNLGINGVTARLFTYFRDKKRNHNGFVLMATAVQLVGFSLFLIVFFLYRPTLVQNNLEKSFLFAKYVDLLIPITFFTLIFTFLDVFNKVLYDAVFGTFLQEFLQRVVIFCLLLLFIFKVLDLNQLILGYAVAVSIKGVVILVYLIFRNEIRLKPDFRMFNPEMRREISNVALFSILGGLGSMLVFNIDKILVNHLLDLTNTGVYTIAFYFGSLVVIPSRPLLKISGTLIADAWKKDDINQVRTIYYKSCINQLIIGGFLFLGIWVNIDDILQILGPDYAASKWVIFFIGLGYLIDMATGANFQIISYSEFYRVNLLFISLLIILVIALMYVLIPMWGIVGAAVAIALSLLLNNLMRYIFLFWKYGMQPFDGKTLIVLFYFVCMAVLIGFIPQLPLLADILVRGAVLTIVTIIFFILFPLTDEIRMLLKKVRSYLR